MTAPSPTFEYLRRRARHHATEARGWLLREATDSPSLEQAVARKAALDALERALGWLDRAKRP